MNGSKAVFLDRDGTLIEDPGYLHSTEQVRWLSDAGRALQAFRDAGYAIVVLTNQSGVARGYFSEDAVRTVNRYVQEQASDAWGVDIARFYYCPHLPAGSIDRYAIECTCRKPGAGMFEDAISDLGIDPAKSISVGDQERDLVPADRLGIPLLFLLGSLGATSYRSEKEYEHAAGWDEVIGTLRRRGLL